MEPKLTSAQEKLQQLWDNHVRSEIVHKDADAAVSCMTDDARIFIAPTMIEALGKEQVREFYEKRLIPQIAPDTKTEVLSRTIGHDCVVDEMSFEFTHTRQVDWILPGVPPSGQRVSFILLVIAKFKDDLLQEERIYWDQASVLVQVGLLDESAIPKLGIESKPSLSSSSI